MCSIQENDGEANDSAQLLIKNLTIEDKACSKCGCPAVIALRTDDIYCRDCFMVRATHRFRCEFGKSRLIRDQEHILVAYSGGSSSCAMVHLIQEGLSKRAHKKLRFIPELVYIDDDVGENSHERRDCVERILNKMHESGLKYYVLSLQQIFDEKLSPIIVGCNDNSTLDTDALLEKLTSVDRSRLKVLMKSVESKTSRESLTYLLRKELLVRWARELEFGKIVFGDSASCLASRLLSSVVQGRGAQIPCEMGFADDRYGDVTLVKPLREFTENEIDVYNSIIIIKPLVPTKIGAEAVSIDGLSKRFVAGLQAEHGGTLAIICRTGEKLEKPDEETETPGENCILCQAPIDSALPDCSASAGDALSFSRSICHFLRKRNDIGKTEAAISNGECAEKPGANLSQAERCTSPELLSSFCYGCKLTIREMADLRLLPQSVLQKAKETRTRDSLRSDIKEFLLGDDVDQCQD